MAGNTQFQVVRETLINHVETEWVDPYPAGPLRTPVEYPNQKDKFVPPTDTPWARLFWTFTTSIDSTIGGINPLNRIIMLVSFDLFVPRASGTLYIYENLLVPAINMFNRRTVEPILFEGSTPSQIINDDPWYRVRVSTNSFFFIAGNCEP